MKVNTRKAALCPRCGGHGGWIEDSPWPPRRGLLRQRDARWHYGTWLVPGLAGGGRGSVDVWRAADGSCLVGAMVEANITPDQAEMLAQALQGAAAKARAEAIRLKTSALERIEDSP